MYWQYPSHIEFGVGLADETWPILVLKETDLIARELEYTDQ